MEMISNGVFIDLADAAFLGANGTGKVAKLIDSQRDIRHQSLTYRLTVFVAFGDSDGFEVGFHLVCDFEEQVGAFSDTGFAPSIFGSMRGIAANIHNFGRLWGFDSFTGLPSEKPGLHVQGRHWRVGSFSAADSMAEHRLDVLLENISRSVQRGNVTLVPGYFADTLKSLSPD